MRTFRTVLTASGVATFALMVPYLVGSLSVALREELSLTPAALGNTVSTFFIAATLAAVPAGRLVDRLGPRRAVIATAVFTSVVLLTIAGVVRQPWHLVSLVMLSGVAHASAQPAANLALLHAVAPGRQGIAMGFKQSAAPLSTVLAGASVPVFGLTVGWRWAFVAFAVAALTPILVAPAGRHMVDRRTPGAAGADASRRSLILLAVGAGSGTVLGTSIGTFLVVSAVEVGLSPGPAGILLTVASVGSIATRLLLGGLVDRHGFNPLTVGAGVISVGAVGLVGIALTRDPGVFVGCAILGTALAWGWPSLLHYSVVRYHSAAAGAATGVVLTGVSIGGIVGPSLFGNVAAAMSFRAAWLTMAGVALLTGALMWRGGREIVRTPAEPVSV